MYRRRQIPSPAPELLILAKLSKPKGATKLPDVYRNHSDLNKGGVKTRASHIVCFV